MLTIDPKEAGNKESFKYLVGAVGPRPIAFVSTISEDGINNLSPFSFFNCFGSNPPVLAFSPSRRGRDNTVKDTYNNLLATKECVIHVVTYSIVEQMNLSSTEFPSDVDEFPKSGFTPLDSDLVKAKRVKESPVHFECKLMQMVELGGQAGSGNLAICEVVKIHINEAVINEKGGIDPFKLDLVGRNGGNWYTRANGEALFELPKPDGIGVGYDSLPDFIKNSKILTGNNLGSLSLIHEIPSDFDVNSFINAIEKNGQGMVEFNIYEDDLDHENMLATALSINENYSLLERTAKIAIENNEREFAWKTLLYSSKA